MKKIKPQEGIIGFFDILGYTNFLENNDAVEAANIAANVLHTLPSEVPSLTAYFLGGNANQYKRGIKRMKWLVFSDTILIALPFKKKVSAKTRFTEWIGFLSTAMFLNRLMFDQGLPIRGAITLGTFVVQDMFFAGKTIVDAYKLAHSLELSATILSPLVDEEILLSFHDSGYSLHHTLLEYLVPLRDNKTERYLTLVPTPCIIPFVGDIPQLVAEAFWKHRKDIAPEVLPKLRNTEIYFRFAKMNHSHSFIDKLPKKSHKKKKPRKRK